jgi:electron-transferring-flavoprotein dehydrogenase
MPVDVLFVGAGPASLAGAYHLLQLVERHNEAIEAGGPGEKIPELEVAIMEKGKALGAHAISGAVLDPRSLSELMPGFPPEDFPGESRVIHDEIHYLTAGGGFRLPFTPPPLANHGNWVVSISKLVRWLGQKVEEKGAFIIPEFAGRECLFEGDRVNGVRTSDKGLDHSGSEKGNFQPGADLTARVTVLGEGPRGSLAKTLIEKYRLDEGKNPQIYATGVKETWKLEPGVCPKGHVVHTMGFPLDSGTFGGGFAYGAADDILFLGFVTGLDYWHPETDPHAELQRLKTHPMVAKWLDGAEVISYGAKTLPEGGWFARPRPYCDGALLVGDCGGFLNPMRLKGIHLGIKSGMLAAETIFEGLIKDDLSETQLASYERRIDSSWIRDEMWKVRNFHQAMAKNLFVGMARTGFQMAFGGRDPFGDRIINEPGHQRMKKISEVASRTREKPEFDNEKLFDKLTNVYQSGTMHEEDQPSHLLVSDLEICSTRCAVEYGNPCVHFCPAAVYEMVEDEADTTRKKLKINASNCVHCKTCDVMDPYQIITWVTPEGGQGPAYKDL